MYGCTTKGKDPELTKCGTWYKLTPKDNYGVKSYIYPEEDDNQCYEIHKITNNTNKTENILSGSAHWTEQKKGEVFGKACCKKNINSAYNNTNFFLWEQQQDTCPNRVPCDSVVWKLVKDTYRRICCNKNLGGEYYKMCYPKS